VLTGTLAAGVVAVVVGIVTAGEGFFVVAAWVVAEQPAAKATTHVNEMVREMRNTINQPR
jgi:hypothetical protein